MPKALFDLSPEDCRYITDDDRKLYCAKPRKHDLTSFCAAHHRLCYKPGTARFSRLPISLPIDRIEVKEEAPVPVEHHPDLVESMR